jgi:hypothetical protein
VRDGRLHVPGLKGPLVRDPIRHIYANVYDLRVERRFAMHEGRTLPRMLVRGRAVLENCTIGVAGEQETNRELKSNCKPCPPDSPHHEWNVIFGFAEADWEFGSEDEWWVE